MKTIHNNQSHLIGKFIKAEFCKKTSDQLKVIVDKISLIFFANWSMTIKGEACNCIFQLLNHGVSQNRKLLIGADLGQSEGVSIKVFYKLRPSFLVEGYISYLDNLGYWMSAKQFIMKKQSDYNKYYGVWCNIVNTMEYDVI